ncbi:hypothetical protein BASA81_008581 [Batrachochytrium salamandrivorans]|nr:hypothetical protein BASA81_008581 [Batrachochytrium salamandrivorans]
MADIGSLPNEVIRYIVREFLTAEDEDQFSLVCKLWKHLRDEDLWKGTKLAKMYDNTRLSKRPFRFFGVRTTGTEGICCKVQFRPNRQLYAMKKARVYPKGEGVPYYMLREIEFLRTAIHPNISALCAVSLRGSELMMFFPYCPRTLHEALNPPNERNESGMPLPLSITKQLLYQILQGLSFCHDRGVLHRNLKPKHLLLCDSVHPDSCLFPRDQHWERDIKLHETIPVYDLQRCQVLISDFALVRTSLLPLRRFTPEVVTLWYRAPEILLGGPYFTSIDVWSVGCVFAEMLTGKPFFAGVCEINQLFEIFSRVGSPTQETWPGFAELPNTSIPFPNWPQIGLKRFFPELSLDGLELLEAMLELNPHKRIHARDALMHPFFAELRPSSPMVVPPTTNQEEEEEDQVEEKGLGNPALLDRYLPNMIQIERDSFPIGLAINEAFTEQRLKASQRIIEINDTFSMSLRTEFLAINLLDRFLHRLSPRTVWPLLLDITCLHMASKCEDVSYIGVGDLINLPPPLENEAGNLMDREKLSQMLLKLQEKVLSVLDFSLQIPTVLDFCLGFCFKLQIEVPPQQSKWYETMCYFAELSLLHSGLVRFRPSRIAFGIVVFTHFVFGKPMNQAKFCDLYALIQGDFAELQAVCLLLREICSLGLDTTNQALGKRYQDVIKPKSFDSLTTQLLCYREWVD